MSSHSEPDHVEVLRVSMNGLKRDIQALNRRVHPAWTDEVDAASVVTHEVELNLNLIDHDLAMIRRCLAELRAQKPVSSGPNVD